MNSLNQKITSLKSEIKGPSSKQSGPIFELKHSSPPNQNCFTNEQIFSTIQHPPSHPQIHPKSIFVVTQKKPEISTDNSASFRDRLTSSERLRPANNKEQPLRIFQLDRCAESYKKNNYQLEERMELDEDHYVCLICQDNFSSKTLLEAHKKTHALLIPQEHVALLNQLKQPSDTCSEPSIKEPSIEPTLKAKKTSFQKLPQPPSTHLIGKESKASQPSIQDSEGLLENNSLNIKSELENIKPDPKEVSLLNNKLNYNPLLQKDFITSNQQSLQSTQAKSCSVCGKMVSRLIHHLSEEAPMHIGNSFQAQALLRNLRDYYSTLLNQEHTPILRPMPLKKTGSLPFSLLQNMELATLPGLSKFAEEKVPRKATIGSTHLVSTKKKEEMTVSPASENAPDTSKHKAQKLLSEIRNLEKFGSDMSPPASHSTPPLFPRKLLEEEKMSEEKSKEESNQHIFKIEKMGQAMGEVYIPPMDMPCVTEGMFKKRKITDEEESILNYEESSSGDIEGDDEFSLSHPSESFEKKPNSQNHPISQELKDSFPSKESLKGGKGNKRFEHGNSRKRKRTDPEYIFNCVLIVDSFDQQKDLHIILDKKDADHKEKYKCEFCNKFFDTGQALGGHQSRKHPQQSTKYNYRQKIRNERSLERKKLLLAKKKYFSFLGTNYDKLRQSKEGRDLIRTNINRSVLRKLKNQIKPEELL